MASNSPWSPVQSLRHEMKKYEGGCLDAYVVPSQDAHQSEYVADCDLRRQFISGFNGSAGLALITTDKCLLWTDGRYFLQATQQLSDEWTLMRQIQDVTVQQWILANLEPGSRVGLDPFCFSINEARQYEKDLEAGGIQLVFVDENLVDSIWEARPPAPQGPVTVHAINFCGESVQEKLNRVRSTMADSNAFALILTALDEVAWLYNIRGSDVAFNPVVYSYAIVMMDSAVFYVDRRKVNQEVEDHLARNGVQIREYSDLLPDVEGLGLKEGIEGQGAWVDPCSCSQAVYSRLQVHLDESEVLQLASPISLAKALKNSSELGGLKRCHVRDGAAMVSFLSWLDGQMQEQLDAPGYFSEHSHGTAEKMEIGSSLLTEVSVATKLAQLRSKQEHFVGLSFPTISSVGPNAAIIHYTPQEATCAHLDPDLIYLCDSGAQYLDGTTDVTRTVHFGRPTPHQRSCFTRVLKGHITLATAVFPNGTTGFTLDILARMHLWRAGLDYNHGTGHGVGCFLNVHEGPQLISFHARAQNVALQASMTVTNEPGYYEDGSFGIRIENVMVVNEVKCDFNFGEKGYLGLEPLTWVPIQVKLIDPSLLTKEEVEWLNEYHLKCRQHLSPLLQGEELDWLIRSTEPVFD